MTAKQEDVARLADDLRKLSESLTGDLTRTKAKNVNKTILNVCERLQNVLDTIDPIKAPSTVFDPANPSIAGRIAAITMIAQPRVPLASIDRIYGAGVYAIYYSGGFPAYASISGKEQPIYVGKADPNTPTSKTPRDQGDRLVTRLDDHRKNIIKASGSLAIEDFHYRALVIQSGWQTAAEDYLIHLFRPIWNKQINICYGLGKHGDDPDTRGNQRSPWDTLHPGRAWAHRDPNMKDARPPSRILEDIKSHFKQHPPFSSVEEILKQFLDEMRPSK